MDPEGIKYENMYRFIIWKHNWKNKSKEPLYLVNLNIFSSFVFTLMDPVPVQNGNFWDLDL